MPRSLPVKVTRRSKPATRPSVGPESKPAELARPRRHAKLFHIVRIALIAICTFIIYGQTIHVPAIGYEDPFYLAHSPYVAVNIPFSASGAVWTEPYFANFHPVTTTTWLVDRALANKKDAFSATPFRVTHLIYAVIGAELLILLFKRLGVPSTLGAIGGLIYAVHPIHTEVVAWLSARKDLISLIFMIAACLAWLWARDASNSRAWQLRHTTTALLVLLAVLSKPIAVVTPALLIAYEFCSGPHVGILRWRWGERQDNPVLTRTILLSVIFVTTLAASTLVFRNLLLRDQAHGGWLIVVLIAFAFLMLAIAPAKEELAAVVGERTAGIRTFGPPFLALSLVSGAGSAWTFWAQSQVGAIKGGLTLLPTLNLSAEAMLAYIGKAFSPAYMSVSYSWSSYPYVSWKGLLGAVLVCAFLWLAMRLAGASDRNLRLIAFGIFWFFIALVPVSNLVPTSTKMADRYLFVPTVGSTLVVLAVASMLIDRRRVKLRLVCIVFAAIVAIYGAWSYKRTEVWCGKTTLWKGVPNPDLSIWTSAVETNPTDAMALTNLSLALLRLEPPQTEEAITHLNRALEVSEASQSNIAGGKQLVLSPMYEGLGDAYLIHATGLAAATPGADGWRSKREAYSNSQKDFVSASQSLSGFASSDARLFSRLAEAYAGEAQMDSLELATGPADRRDAYVSERDRLWGESEKAIERAHKILEHGRVSTSDSNYRSVMLTRGNVIFNREVGATDSDKRIYYARSLALYQEAEALFLDDPRPFLYQGLCHERLAGLAQKPEDRNKEFAFGEEALRSAMERSVVSEDYNPSLPYRALASLYMHLNDYRPALDALKNARRLTPDDAASAQLDRDIQSLEQYLDHSVPK